MMPTTPKNQIIGIHGGFSREEVGFWGRILEFVTRFITDSQFFRSFTKKEIPHLLWDPEDMTDIHLLNMPRRYAADYDEWKEYFENTVKDIPWNIILVGHSLGATFLIKYLAESNRFIDRITSAYIVAGFFKRTKIERLWETRTFAPKKWAQFLGDFPISIIHGDQDRDVSFDHFRELQRVYPADKNPRISFRKVPGWGHYLWTHAGVKLDITT